MRELRREGAGCPEGGVGGVRLCVSHLLNAVILPKVMTEPRWDFHSAFRCS